MIVIDASAVLEILRQSDLGNEMNSALSGLMLDAPHLIDIEVMHALRRWTHLGKMTDGDAERVLAVFLGMPIRRHPHRNLLPDIWSLRHNLTAYDATYLALARHLDAELLTMDEGLKKRSKRR